MLLPNKLFSYEESILSRFPVVLSVFQKSARKIHADLREEEL